MQRYIHEHVRRDLDSRIVLVSGPRQSGKTTLARMIFENHDYLNHDLAEHRVAMAERSWDRDADLVVLDELHKKKDWKQWLKGIYDVEGVRPRLLVTGSARLDMYRKVGDSLAGRFFPYTLHPLDLREVAGSIDPREAFDRLMRFGGFPEPFLQATERFYKRWRRTHLDIILRQDLVDLAAINDIQAIETLVELLRRRVGSTVSYASLARDLERDPKTIKRWLGMLENLYVIFRVTPYSRNVARSLLKEPKFYFYDTGLVSGDGAKLENLVATTLHKELDLVRDTRGDSTRLHYLRTREGREVDFAIVIEDAVRALIEVKSTHSTDIRHLVHFGRFLPDASRVLLVRNLDRERTYPDGTEVREIVPWLVNTSVGV